VKRLGRDEVRAVMARVVDSSDGVSLDDDAAELSQVGFRSLNFSELALRVEDEIGVELNFDAVKLRRIATVGDVLDFMEELQSVPLESQSHGRDG
jgi:acyl carrier protein